MAIYNGSVTLNTSKFGCYINTWESNIDNANNTSLVTAEFHITRSSWGWSGGSYSGNIVIDGAPYSFSYSPNWAYGSSGDVIVGTASRTITHNADGSRSCGVSASWNTSGTYSCGTASASGTLTLTTIPRESTPTLSKTNFNIGENITINTNRASSSFVHAIYFSFGSISWQLLSTGIDTSYTWNTASVYSDKSLYTELPNSNSGTGTIFLETYNSSTYIGTKSITFTANVVNSNPTFSNFTVQDSNNSTYALTGDRNKFINKYSNAEISITSANKMVTKNSATPINYLAVNGSKTPITIPYHASNTVTGTINNIESSIISVSAVDSRGLQTTVSKTINLIDYSEPIVQNFNIYRVDGAGTNAVLSMSGIYSTANFGTITNTLIAMKIRYKSTSSGTYSAWTNITSLLTFSSGNFSVNNATITGITFDLGTTYDVQILLQDKLSETVQQGVINDGKVLMAVSKGNGVSFGSVYNTTASGALQVNGKSLLNLTYPVGSYFISRVSTSPATLFGGTWIQITNSFLVGAGGTYAVDSTGGAATHTLANTEIPAHKHAIYGGWNNGGTGNDAYLYNSSYQGDVGYKSHSYFGTDNAGGGGAHNNMPPYRAAYMWYRSA